MSSKAKQTTCGYIKCNNKLEVFPMHKKFCCDDCRIKNAEQKAKDNRAANRKEKICIKCGNKFETSYSRQKVCSADKCKSLLQADYVRIHHLKNSVSSELELKLERDMKAIVPPVDDEPVYKKKPTKDEAIVIRDYNDAERDMINKFLSSRA